jgi:hypothetical protein
MSKYIETSYSTTDENYLMFPDEHDEKTRIEDDRILEQIAFTPRPVAGKIFRIYLRQDYHAWSVDLGSFCSVFFINYFAVKFSEQPNFTKHQPENFISG